MNAHPIIRIARLLTHRKGMVAVLFLLIAVSSGFDIVVPFISRALIDRLIAFFNVGGAAPLRFLIFAAGGILLATVLSKAVKAFYDYRLFTMVTGLEDLLRGKATAKYLSLHALFHHGASSGQVIGKLERGAVAVYIILFELFGQNLLPPLIIFTGVLAVLIVKSPIIALAVFLPLPIYLASIKKLTDKIYLIEKQALDGFEAVEKETYDVAANVLTVKKFSQEETEVRRQVAGRAEARVIQYSAERLWNVLESIQTFVASAGRIGVILLAGFLVLKGKSTIGEFVLYITLQNMAYHPLAQLSVIFPRLRRNLARAERLFYILDEPARVTDKPDAKEIPPFSAAIALNDVSFRYHPDGRWTIQDVDVVIPKGMTLALVGRSGSGKTTFINLLLRSYDPERGAILVDGNDLRDVKRESLLRQIAVVPQEVDLFSRTIAENIAYGRPEVSRDNIMEAAKTALAHDFIMRTERGYDTLVGERGIKLSGGERQRIGIARAVLRDPQILILDEATSHLDTESEQLIAKATDALVKNRTTIIIAHRLSTVMRADRILVFADGRIEASGAHDELIRTSPTYQKLYALQFRNH